jgi:hypothetical protein
MLCPEVQAFSPLHPQWAESLTKESGIDAALNLDYSPYQ